jgi:cytochrome b561
VNEARVYGAVAKGLHWLVAMLLAAQYAIAWSMPHIGRGTEPVGLIDWHLSVGTLILLVVAVRLVWSLAYPVPLVSGPLPAWQARVARTTHLVLYALLLVLPLMGWANASARGWTVRLFGLGPLPAILPTDSPLGGALGDIHATTALVLLGLAGLHIAAALYHGFVLRDGILRRMLP